ncbi:hypothetical protein OK006_5236 [Actinobacteria bacterium OK006]|nr:hypothetical protein OK006_5236 [Actinobacteria bacterium OK006]
MPARTWGYRGPRDGPRAHGRWPTATGNSSPGVECDGAMYHSSKAARDRDRLREGVLRGLGWELYRIWGTDWYRDRSGAEVRLRAAVERAAALVGTSPGFPGVVEGDAARPEASSSRAEPHIGPGWRSSAGQGAETRTTRSRLNGTVRLSARARCRGVIASRGEVPRPCAGCSQWVIQCDRLWLPLVPIPQTPGLGVHLGGRRRLPPRIPVAGVHAPDEEARRAADAAAHPLPRARSAARAPSRWPACTPG